MDRRKMGAFAYIVFLAALGVVGIWLFVASLLRSEIKSYQCKNCGYDLRYTKDRCPDCGKAIHLRVGDYFPLRDEWPATPITPRKPEPSETPVVIRSTGNAAEAKLIEEQLNARGIACWISQHKPNQLIGYSTPLPADSHLTVWSQDESDARELLDRLMRPNARGGDAATKPGSS